MALDELAEALRHDLADEHAAEAQRRGLDEARSAATGGASASPVAGLSSVTRRDRALRLGRAPPNPRPPPPLPATLRRMI